MPENDPKIAESLCNFSYRLLVCGPRQFTALSWFEQKCVNSCYTLDKRIKYTENPFIERPVEHFSNKMCNNLVFSHIWSEDLFLDTRPVVQGLDSDSALNSRKKNLWKR